MVRLIVLVVAWVGLLLVSGAQASLLSERQPVDIGVDVARNALVIGNSKYDNITPLPNTANDAEAVSNALASVGFHVFQAIDVDRVTMSDVIGQFLNSITPGSEALVYYAGHGVELDGQNYLLPIDIRRLNPDQQYSLRTDGVSLASLLADLESRKPRVSLIILDACRNNPFLKEGKALGGHAGLGRIDPPQSMLVMYAAAAGELALDNLGEQDTDPNGLFTRNFLKLVNQPGLEIRAMVQELKDRVYEAARQTQRPTYYDGLIGKFYFLPLREDFVPDVDPCVLEVNREISAKELLFIEPSSAIMRCSAALQSDPGSAVYKELLGIAQEQRAAQRALLDNNPRLSSAYLELYPSGRFAADVRSHLASLTVSEPIRVPEPTLVPTPVPEPGTTSDPGILTDVNTPEVQVDMAALTRDVQTELNRVGCSVGKADGKWGQKSERALDEFSRMRGIVIAELEPSPSVLEQLKSASSRVCPLVCSTGQKESNGVCVAITCPKGQELSKGVCVKVAVKCPKGQRLSTKGQCYTPSTGGSTTTSTPSTPPVCFTFNGERFCE